MNTDEMAETITLNGVSVAVIKDDKLNQIVVNQFENSGLMEDITTIYIADVDWPTGVNKPVPAAEYTINSKKMLVVKSDLQFGLWQINFRTISTAAGYVGFG